ncbi:MFS transporter [Frankia sp. Cppng1_Ct_nod]|uniref:MFS transporter n=1 Tax=Frankia sp. Cppng1_Ct_nod TaxID=2897162 RepID=UPI0020250583|nr:MFS transporter [Frankia sp. Cppng1_Ct_nod]
MYATLRDRPPDPAGSGARRTPGAAGTTSGRRESGGAAHRLRRAVGAGVLLLGLTSLLTDLSTEMVTAVLPLYLVGTLGFTPFQYGLVNGLHQGLSALVRLVSGLASDRWRRHRDVAASGYALSAVAKIVLVVGAASPAVVSGSLVTDRIGKGIRTAPRDALLSLATASRDLGLVFGVHRALDTVGAMLGPFVAFALLAASPESYDLVFVVSACVALTGVAVIVLLVERDPPAGASDPVDGERAPTGQRPHAVRAAAALLAGRRYRALVIAAVALSLCAVGDGFVYLRLQQQVDVAAYYFPLLAAGTSWVYLVLAVPLGQLADRVGRMRILVVGHAALIAVYLLLLVPRPGVPVLLGCLGLLGMFYAATDSVMAAAVSALLPRESRTSGIAMLQSCVALGQLVASAGFGAVWTTHGARSALWLACGVGAGACLLTVTVVSRAGTLTPAVDSEPVDSEPVDSERNADRNG